METDVKEEPWFSNGFPAFNHCGWQKTPFFWSNNHQKIPAQQTPFRSAPSVFTANEAMFGYTQPGFIPTRHPVIGHGANNLYNNFAIVHPNNWFETKNPQFGNGDSETTFGTNIRFQPTFATETTVNNTNVKVRYQTITIMPQYRDKSFEELRLEDYIANRHRTHQVHSTQFSHPDFVQNEVPFFDALLRNSNNTFQGQFFSSEESSGRSNISDNVTNKYTEHSPLTNPNFLLEYLLNHVKNRLNVQLISDKTRYTCEKLTTKLAEYTEKTLESLTVVVLEDILATIKGKNQITVPSTSFVAPKVGESEQLSEAASNRKSKTKSQHGAKKVESRIVADTNSSCPRSAQPPKKEIAFESEDDACSDASSAADEWCCASKHQAAAKKQRDRPACAECQCEARKKPSSRCTASAVASGGGHSRTSGLRKSSQGDCCAKEISMRRMCGSKCAKSKWTPSKSTSRRCQMAKRITHRCYDDEFYIRQRLKSVRVDTDDGEEGDKAADAPHKEKLMVRCKAALGDDCHATGGATSGAAAGDEGKDAQPPVTTDARSNDGTDESDFSSV